MPRSSSVIEARSTRCCLLRAGLVDEVRIHLAPVLLGAGTRLLDDDDGHIRLQPTRITESSKATHLRYRVQTVDGTG
jgi:riboflavin biosynthesis pyrimidine reductase